MSIKVFCPCDCFLLRLSDDGYPWRYLMVGLLDRITRPTMLILNAFLESSNELYGFEIIKKTGLTSGTVYTILDRLEKLAWLDAHWEESGSAESRPSRRYYVLNKAGQRQALKVVDVPFKLVSPKGPACYSKSGIVGRRDPRYEASSGIDIKFREDFAVLQENYMEVGSRCEVLFDPDKPANLISERRITTSLDVADPFANRQIIIDGIDHTGDFSCVWTKETLDIEHEVKIIEYLSEIPLNLFAKGRGSVIVETRAKLQKNSSRFPNFEFRFDYPTEEFCVNVESLKSNLRLSDTDYLGRSVSSSVTATLGQGYGEIIDFRDSESQSKKVRSVDNRISWKPKKVKSGYTYFLHTKNIA